MHTHTQRSVPTLALTQCELCNCVLWHFLLHTFHLHTAHNLIALNNKTVLKVFRITKFHIKVCTNLYKSLLM